MCDVADRNVSTRLTQRPDCAIFPFSESEGAHLILRESLIQNEVMGVLNQKDSGCRVWRNNVGFDHMKQLRYGLAPGSADLVGGATVLVTPEMVGQKLFVFLADEIKTPKGRFSSEQIAWLQTIKRLGGIVRNDRSRQSAVEFIERLRDGRLFQ